MGQMKREVPSIDSAVLRVALAVPLAYEAYRLVTFAATASSWDLLSWVAGKGSVLLPALGLVLGCALVVFGRTWPWAWLLVAASGVWVFLYDVYPHAQLSYPWRVSTEMALGVYTSGLAAAVLIGRLRSGRARPGGPAADSTDLHAGGQER